MLLGGELHVDMPTTTTAHHPAGDSFPAETRTNLLHGPQQQDTCCLNSRK
jgi:hypothetical protein